MPVNTLADGANGGEGGQGGNGGANNGPGPGGAAAAAAVAAAAAAAAAAAVAAGEGQGPSRTMFSVVRPTRHSLHMGGTWLGASGVLTSRAGCSGMLDKGREAVYSAGFFPGS